MPNEIPIEAGRAEELVIACDDPARAAAAAARLPSVRRAWTSREGLHVVIRGGRPAVDELRERLTRARVTLWRIAPPAAPASSPPRPSEAA